MLLLPISAKLFSDNRLIFLLTTAWVAELAFQLKDVQYKVKNETATDQPQRNVLLLHEDLADSASWQCNWLPFTDFQTRCYMDKE